MRIYLFILSILFSLTGVSAQPKASYCLIDTVELRGYLVYRYQKEDIEMHRKYQKHILDFERGLRSSLEIPIDWGSGVRYWVTTQIDNKPGLDLERIQAILPENYYESIENVFFPPVSSYVEKNMPELANCRDTVIFPLCSYYKRTGDDKYLYTFTVINGTAERYLVKTKEGFPYSGWVPEPCVRVPYVYLYFFRWKDKVSLTPDTPLDGYELFWDRKY